MRWTTQQPFSEINLAIQQKIIKLFEFFSSETILWTLNGSINAITLLFAKW